MNSAEVGQRVRHRTLNHLVDVLRVWENPYDPSIPPFCRVRIVDGPQKGETFDVNVLMLDPVESGRGNPARE